jgi:Protein of unknown function (DUF3717)
VCQGAQSLSMTSTALHITDLEAAINWWRERQPSDGLRACAEVRALAEPYGWMVWHGLHELDSIPRRVAGVVRQHARCPVHRHLFHRPRGCRVQGLWPHRTRGAALAADGSV